jgi:hypothetical protein
MSTAAQTAANQANAQHSTGPRSSAGKAAVAQNARTHGLTASRPVILPGDQPVFDSLSESLRASLRPEGAMEEILFGRILHSAWNLQRIDRLEADLVAGGLDPLLNESCAPTLDRLARYRATSERSLYRAIKELRTQQNLRMERLALPPQTANPLPPQGRVAFFNQSLEITKQSQNRASEEEARRHIQRWETEIQAGLRLSRTPITSHRASSGEEPAD